MQIKLLVWKIHETISLCANKLLILDRIIWNDLTVCKQMSSVPFKNVIYKLFAYNYV